MKLWKRAAGAIKDQSSLFAAGFTRRTSFRNPDLESAIIKATSHNEHYVDYRNAQRVFTWIRTSPLNIKPLVWALSSRMQRTRSWIVALKGLMLMHGVFCCKVPALRGIGRLPFDLSNFSDGHDRACKVWGFNAFVRAYFAFLDQRSTLFRDQGKQSGESKPMVQELVKLQKWQALLDTLLQIKPLADNMKTTLILEAMDCIIIELFDVYSRICSGVANVLVSICSAGKLEAAMALKVLQKAMMQGDDISVYFEFCKDFGVLNANEFPKVSQIPEEDIRELERIINGETESEMKIDDKAIVEHKEQRENQKENSTMKTIITEKWEVFDEENLNSNGDQTNNKTGTPPPSAASVDHLLLLLPLVPVDEPAYKNYDDIPDFIRF